MNVQQPGEDLFDAMSRHMRSVAKTFLWTLTQDFGAGSRATADLRDGAYDAQWGRPLFQYVHRIAPLVASVHDHMLAASLLIPADKVAQAPVTVARTAMEGLSMMYWLYDPEITQKEKARRHIRHEAHWPAGN